jgi:hypothetical protein
MVMPRSKTIVLALPPRADRQKRQRLIDTLCRLKELRGEFLLDPSAKTEYENWYQTILYLPKNPHTEPFLNRLPAYALKFAMVFCAMNDRRSLVINHQEMKEAVSLTFRFWEDLQRITQDELVFNNFQSQAKKTTDIIKSKGIIGQSELLRMMKNEATYQNKINQTLVESDQVIQIQLPSTGKKKKNAFATPEYCKTHNLGV